MSILFIQICRPYNQRALYLSRVRHMPQEMPGQKPKLDGEDDDYDGADDVERDGATAQRRVEVLHRRELVAEVGAGYLVAHIAEIICPSLCCYRPARLQ